MSVINLKRQVDPPIHVADSLVTVAQSVSMIIEDVAALEVAAVSRIDIIEALSDATSAIHSASIALQAAYSQMGASERAQA